MGPIAGDATELTHITNRNPTGQLDENERTTKQETTTLTQTTAKIYQRNYQDCRALMVT